MRQATEHPPNWLGRPARAGGARIEIPIVQRDRGAETGRPARAGGARIEMPLVPLLVKPDCRSPRPRGRGAD